MTEDDKEQIAAEAGWHRRRRAAPHQVVDRTKEDSRSSLSTCRFEAEQQRAPIGVVSAGSLRWRSLSTCRFEAEQQRAPTWTTTRPTALTRKWTRPAATMRTWSERRRFRWLAALEKGGALCSKRKRAVRSAAVPRPRAAGVVPAAGSRLRRHGRQAPWFNNRDNFEER